MGAGLAWWTTAGISSIWFIASVCAGLKVATDQGITQVGVAAVRELFRVLKDHKNQMFQELVNASYGHCFRNEMDSLLGKEDFMDTQDCGTEKVARVWLTNSRFGSALKRSITKPQDAKLPIDKFGFIYLLLFIYYFPTIKITQALHYTKMWRGDLRKPQGLYEEAPSLQ